MLPGHALRKYAEMQHQYLKELQLLKHKVQPWKYAGIQVLLHGNYWDYAELSRTAVCRQKACQANATSGHISIYMFWGRWL